MDGQDSQDEQIAVYPVHPFGQRSNIETIRQRTKTHRRAGNATKNALRHFPITMYRPAHTQHAAIPNKEAGNDDALTNERTSNPFDASRKMFGTIITP